MNTQGQNKCMNNTVTHFVRSREMKLERERDETDRETGTWGKAITCREDTITVLSLTISPSLPRAERTFLSIILQNN